MDHPDFRVGGKIFATLGHAGDQWGMVKLTPEQQAAFVQSEPDVFQPVKGGWGRRGYTSVFLEKATTSVVRKAMVIAWRNTAPKRLLQQDTQRLTAATKAIASRKGVNRRKVGPDV